MALRMLRLMLLPILLLMLTGVLERALVVPLTLLHLLPAVLLPTHKHQMTHQQVRLVDRGDGWVTMKQQQHQHQQPQRTRIPPLPAAAAEAMTVATTVTGARTRAAVKAAARKTMQLGE